MSPRYEKEDDFVRKMKSMGARRWQWIHLNTKLFPQLIHKLMNWFEKNLSNVENPFNYLIPRLEILNTMKNIFFIH